MKRFTFFLLIFYGCNNHKALSKEERIDSIAEKQRIYIDSVVRLSAFDDSLLKKIRLELITYDSIHNIFRSEDYYITYPKILLKQKIDSLKAAGLYPKYPTIIAK